MMKVPQKKTTVTRPRSSRKRKIAAECESIDSGEKQHKVWKPREQKQTTSTTNVKLQTKVWDLGRQRTKEHDQEIMIILTLGV